MIFFAKKAVSKLKKIWVNDADSVHEYFKCSKLKLHQQRSLILVIKHWKAEIVRVICAKIYLAEDPWEKPYSHDHSLEILLKTVWAAHEDEPRGRIPEQQVETKHNVSCFKFSYLCKTYNHDLSMGAYHWIRNKSFKFNPKKYEQSFK